MAERMYQSAPLPEEQPLAKSDNPPLSTLVYALRGKGGRARVGSISTLFTRRLASHDREPPFPVPVARVLSRVDRGLQGRFIEEEVALLSEKQRRMPRIAKGLVIVYTGRGKGKTTAALGLVLRALGQGLRVCVVQFIKSDKGRWGETLMAEKLGLEWHAMGEGFTWRSEHLEDDAARAREAWTFAREKIARGEYDLVVLDEFTYTLAYSWLDTDQAISWLAAFRPRETHVVITGRDAPPALIDFADLVTDMRAVKHPFDAGVPAQRGIEF